MEGEMGEIGGEKFISQRNGRLREIDIDLVLLRRSAAAIREQQSHSRGYPVEGRKSS